MKLEVKEKQEVNHLVKKKLIQCKTSKDIVLLAKKYGYYITIEDFNYDKIETQFGLWFKES